MNRTIYLGMLVAGVVLTIYGVSSLESVASSFSQFFRGTPTDKTMWMIIGGIACAAIGMAGIARDLKS